MSSQVDFLNNTTSFTYDNMGRVLTKTQPDGFVTTTSYNWGLTGGPSYAVYNIQQSGNDGSLAKTWSDKLGREIRNDVKAFDGSYIYTVTEYNTKGQVYRISEPSTSTSPSQWNTNTFDSYGLIDYITRPSGLDTDYSYFNNRVTETTGGKTSWKETDRQGLLTQAHDNGGDIVYAYFPDRKVKTITTPGSVVTTMEYNDAARNQTKLIDPSAGTIEYTYNSFGQQLTQKNARNQTTTYNYYTDVRLNTRVNTEGTTTYSYNGNKQLTGVSSPGSVSRGYTYDSKGRVTNISETIPGSSAFSTTFTFDSYGRLSTRTHPSGIVETNNYNSNGYLYSISAGGATRYRITGMNVRQQITAATYGSSLYATFGFDSYGYPTYSKAQAVGTYKQDYRYTFNTATGNLSSRQNYLRSLSESFTYDNLDRLIGVSGPQNLTMGYATNGNITTKSDVGTNTFEYNYSAKPYALSDVGTSNGLISDSLQVATYTSFEQVSTIDEGIYHATFTYNSEDQRNKMVVTESGGAILTRWYAGSRYIKETGTTPSEYTIEYTWIGGDAYTAPVLTLKYSSGTIIWFNLLRDYLGNITHFVLGDGYVAAEYNYDAWGRRRDKDNWSYTLSGEPDLLAGRSFTGHEYLPWFNLINMNGRLYDPVVGRFLSVDNYIQNPDFSQSYNRYSYCLNNPLKFTDPSGEKWRWGNPFYHFDRLATKFMDWVNGNTKGLRKKIVDAGLPPFGAGYNTSDGWFYYINNSGNIYPKQSKQEAKAQQKVNKKIEEVQTYSQAWNTNSSGGTMGEYIGTTGLGLSFEIAFPKFVTRGLTSYTGAGLDVGILRDKNGLGFYATTKTTKQSGVAFSAQLEYFSAFNRPSSAPNANIDRTYLVGSGYETSLGIGPVGGSYGVNNAADYGRLSTYQMISISFGLGLDAGFINWKTNTYTTGGY